MPKKSQNTLDVLSTLPWYVSVLLSGCAYIALTYILPSIDTGNPLTNGMIEGISTVAPLLALILLVPAPVSLYHRHRKKKLLDQKHDIQSIKNLSWRQFEELIGEYYRRQGYHVIENDGAGADGGIDLDLRKSGERYLVQCKNWTTNQVGVKVVREIFGLVAAENASGAIVVISGRYTKDAQQFAQGKPIELVDGQQLSSMIRSVQNAPAAQVLGSSNKEEVTFSTDGPACPVCGAKMLTRTARKGPKAGEQFWGCSKFPKCRGTQSK